MAASLRSTRPVAKAALPNRVGRLGHRLSESIRRWKWPPTAGLNQAGHLAENARRRKTSKRDAFYQDNRQPRIAERYRAAQVFLCLVGQINRQGELGSSPMNVVRVGAMPQLLPS
jgi:hypothetical protein